MKILQKKQLLYKQFAWRNLDVVLIWVVTLIFILDRFIGYFPPLFYFLSSLFLLYLPGYLLSRVLFERSTRLAGFELVLFSILFSLALIVFNSLLINFAGFPLNGSDLLASLLGWMLIFSFLVFLKRNGSYREPFKQWASKFNPRLLTLKTSFLLIIIAMGAFVFLNTINSNRNGEKFTEFYVTAIDNKGKETTSITKETLGLNIFITNYEQGAKNYSIWIMGGGNFYKKFEVGRLEPNATWSYNLAFTSKVQNNDHLILELFKDNETKPYRKLSYWLTRN